MSTPLHESRASLRVSDADRDLVTNLLNSAFAEGRITSDELDERVTKTLSAKTFGDLEPLTTDLMSLAPGAAPYQVPQAAVHPTGSASATPAPIRIEPSASPGEVDRIVRVLGDHRRSGSWRLAERTSIMTAMGDVVLDLREAIWSARRCEITIGSAMGDVKVIVPDGVEVVNNVTSVLGDDKIKGMRPAPAGAPQLVLSGFIVLGDVSVRGPDYKSLRQRLGLGTQP